MNYGEQIAAEALADGIEQHAPMVRIKVQITELGKFQERIQTMPGEFLVYPDTPRDICRRQIIGQIMAQLRAQIQSPDWRLKLINSHDISGAKYRIAIGLAERPHFAYVKLTMTPNRK